MIDPSGQAWGLGWGSPKHCQELGSPRGEGAQRLKCHQVVPGCWQCLSPPLTTSTVLARGSNAWLKEVTCRQAGTCVHLEEVDSEPGESGHLALGGSRLFQCGSCQPAPGGASRPSVGPPVCSDCTHLFHKSLCGCFLLCGNAATNKSEDSSGTGGGGFREGLQAFWDNKGEF